MSRGGYSSNGKIKRLGIAFIDRCHEPILNPCILYVVQPAPSSRITQHDINRTVKRLNLINELVYLR